MYYSEIDFKRQLRRLEAQAAKSELARESPGTAKHYAEVVAKQVDKLGVKGFDRHAVTDLIVMYSNLIDLQPVWGGHDRVTFRAKKTKTRGTR